MLNPLQFMKREGSDDISFEDITDKDVETHQKRMDKQFWGTWQKMPAQAKRQYQDDGRGHMGRSEHYYSTKASAESYEEDTRRGED